MSLTARPLSHRVASSVLLAGLALVIWAPGETASGQQAPPDPPADRASGGGRADVVTVLIPRPEVEPLVLGERLPADVAAVPFDDTLPPAERRPVPLLSGDATGPFVLLFWSARCPVSRRYGPEIRRLEQEFGKVRFAALFPDDDEPDALCVEALAARDVEMPALRDRGHTAATRLGVWVTPTALVFDGQGVLRYRGPLDDDRGNRNREPQSHLRAALNAVLEDQPVESAEPRPFGSAVRHAPAD